MYPPPPSIAALADGSAWRRGSSKVAVSCALVKLIQEPRLEPALLLNRKSEMRNVRIVGRSADGIGSRSLD